MSSRLMNRIWHTKTPLGILCQVANTSVGAKGGESDDLNGRNDRKDLDWGNQNPVTDQKSEQ